MLSSTMYSYIHVDFLRLPVFSQHTERQIRQLLPFVLIAVLDTSIFLEADSMSFVALFTVLIVLSSFWYL